MKKMLAIILAVFILAVTAASGFYAMAEDGAAEAENTAQPEDKASEDTAENTTEEQSARESGSKRRQLRSTDGADNGQPIGKQLSKASRVVDSASNRFMLARDARQTAPIEGDYVALGDDAEVSRGVGGDVFTAGRNVLVTDDEELQNVAAAGGNVNIHVKNARNIYVAGADVDVQADDSAEGIYIAGLSVTLAGTMKDAYVAALSANITGTVAENLTIRANNVTFDPDATVGGEITIYAKNRPDLPASIDPAKVVFKKPGIVNTLRDGGWASQTALQKLGLILTVSGIAAAVLLSLALNAMRGGFFHERALGFKKSVGRDLLIGLAGIVVVPVLGLLLLASVVAAPIGAVLLALYGIALYLSPVVAGVILGRLIFPSLNRFGSGAIVTCLLWLLMLVPYLGIVISIASRLFGIGSLLAGIPPRRGKRLKAHRLKRDETPEPNPA